MLSECKRMEVGTERKIDAMEEEILLKVEVPGIRGCRPIKSSDVGSKDLGEILPYPLGTISRSPFLPSLSNHYRFSNPVNDLRKEFCVVVGGEGRMTRLKSYQTLNMSNMNIGLS